VALTPAQIKEAILAQLASAQRVDFDENRSITRRDVDQLLKAYGFADTLDASTPRVRRVLMSTRFPGGEA
jgi:hypothetical protein